jgi:hypothetical protein
MIQEQRLAAKQYGRMQGAKWQNVGEIGPLLHLLAKIGLNNIPLESLRLLFIFRRNTASTTRKACNVPNPRGCAVRGLEQKFALEDAIGSNACSRFNRACM